MGTMDAGNMYEMYAVAASVIGGVSTLGGQGILLGTVIGASIWGVLQNGLQFAARRSPSATSSSASSSWSPSCSTSSCAADASPAAKRSPPPQRPPETRIKAELL